jgi:hypothetical protein
MAGCVLYVYGCRKDTIKTPRTGLPENELLWVPNMWKTLYLN